MTVESSFVPFPSEVIMPPAGYLSFIGEMNIYMVILSGTLGSLLGALINYYLSFFLGRPFIVKYGKYFFVNKRRLELVENYFVLHGEITTFIGRLLPGIRQYISIPAGLAKMPVYKFIFFTFFGAFIWVTILTLIGYYIGVNLALIKEKINIITIFMLPAIIFIVITYIYIYRKKFGRTSK
jgi:membrane protein DedA with SNARE-associated domain